MDGMYPILLCGQAIGQAEVHREGLYMVFSCACVLSGEIVYALVARQRGQTVNLGIPIPLRGRFRLETRVPAKRFQEGTMEICAVPKHGDLGAHIVPLSPEEPFGYISRLEKAYLQRRGRELWIGFRD